MMKCAFLKTKFLLISICLFLASICFVGVGFTTNALASTRAINANLFLPNSNVEYYSLSAPIDAYSDDSVTAIIQGDQTLVINYNGKFTTLGGGIFTDLQQVKKLNDTTLLVLDYASIYTIDLITFTKAPLQYNSNVGGVENISCNFFDFNGTHLVTTFYTTIVIYTFNDGDIIEKRTVEGSSKNPIAINDSGEFFYINSNGALCSRNVNDQNDAQATIILPSLKPVRMIANDTSIYYLLDNKIYTISLSENDNIELIPKVDERFDLGKIQRANGISFKNGNLLVSDSELEAVSEFKINGNDLEFTGFAVAKNKTAFNRVSNDVIDIEKDYNTLAVLDGFKLTITDISNNFSTYEKNRFTEFLATDLGGVMPEAFAYGNGFALLSFNHFTSSSYLRLLNVNDRTITEEIKLFDGNVIRDICYSDGYFYVLCDHGDNISKVYRFSFDDLTFSNPIITTNFYSVKLNVDLSKNVYLYSSSGNFNKFIYSNDYQLDTSFISPLSNIIEFEFDFANGIFALTDTDLCYLDNSGVWQKFKIDVDYNINSFALDFDKKDVYLSVIGQELLYKTTELNNISIDTLEIPTIILYDKAASSDGFKAYTSIDPSFTYQVTFNNDLTTLTFDKRVVDLTEYAFIAEINADDQFGKQVKYYLLAGQNIFVVINELDVVEHNIQFESAPQSAFITTTVNAYYLPIITPDDIFVCRDSEVLRLSKHQQIFPIKSLKFLDKDFYLATVSINQSEYLAYVPVDFTVEILSKDFNWKEYRYEKVNSTDVYADIEMTEKIASLNSNEKIRVYDQDGDILLITYLSTETNEWELGYITASALKNESNKAFRNVVIILIVSLCVCATTVFLVVKKSKK